MSSYFVSLQTQMHTEARSRSFPHKVIELTGNAVLILVCMGHCSQRKMNVSCSCFEADKLIVETTLSWGSAEITLREISDVAPPAPTLLRHRRHQLLTSACTRQIPRVSNRMVLEDSNWSLPRLTSFCHIYWCEDIVLDLELKMWDFDVIHSGNIFSVYKGSVCLLAHLPVI